MDDNDCGGKFFEETWKMAIEYDLKKHHSFYEKLDVCNKYQGNNISLNLKLS